MSAIRSGESRKLVFPLASFNMLSFSETTQNALHFDKKNPENLTKTKEVTVFFSLKPEVAGNTPAVTIFYSVLILLVTNYLRQF